MEERREFTRFDILRKAQLCTDPKCGWQECTIFNISRKGMGIIFHIREEINVGSTIYLEVLNAEDPILFSVKGILKWIEEREDGFVGGIELMKELDDEKLNKLR